MSGHYRSYDDDGNPIDVYEFHLVPGWGPSPGSACAASSRRGGSTPGR